MRKILVIGGILACILATTLFAVPEQKSGSCDEIVIQKLDQILKNQDEMFEYLKFIKNRSR